MKAARIVLVGGLLASAWALNAKPAPRPAAGPSPEQLVAARQAGMGMSVPTLGNLSAGSANGTSPKTLAFPARSLARWADAMPALFAASTAGLQSRAKPEIWSDPAGFAARAKAYQDATKAVVAASEADNKEAFAAALASVKAACKGCHDTYQVPPQPQPPRPVG
jgi:cytochrome c556